MTELGNKMKNWVSMIWKLKIIKRTNWSWKSIYKKEEVIGFSCFLVKSIYLFAFYFHGFDLYFDIQKMYHDANM